MSSVFRKHAAPGQRLADWTRHIDGDWQWYCPKCCEIVILIEEKGERFLQKAWTVTRRLATRHEDRPWGWRVVCKSDGTFFVSGARNNGSGHESFFGDRAITEDELVSWIEKAFEQHYAARHGEERAAA